MKDSLYPITEVPSLSKDELKFIENGHIKDEEKQGIICSYVPFKFTVTTQEGKLIGALQGYTAFAEVYIDDIWVSSDHRKKGLGKQLLKATEDKFQGKGYNNINLVTSSFQAPDFYKKCGYEVEFIRENKHNPLLTKVFFIKYFSDKKQHQGTLNQESMG